MFGKFNCIIIAFLCVFSSYSQIEAIEVIYSQAIGKTRDTVYTNVKKLAGMNYSLKANSTSAVFVRKKTMNNDYYAANEHYMYSSGASGIFYKNLETNEKLREEDIYGEKILVSYPMNDLDWVITKDFKMIDDFLVYKAYSVQKEFSKTHNKEFEIVTTAWFAPKIPFSFGPRGCDGLPGLILEASFYSGSIYFVAEKITIYSEGDKKGFDIVRPTKGKEMTFDESLIYVRKISNSGN